MARTRPETIAINHGKHLARSAAGDVLARLLVLTTGDINALPGPVSAGAGTAQDVDRLGGALDGAGDLVDGDILNGDAVGGGAGRRTVLVVLLDDDAVLGDVLELDVVVGDVGDGAGLLVDGLDADAVVGVDDVAVGDVHALDDVVVAAADGADRQAVAAGAVAAVEVDVLVSLVFFSKE